MQVWGLTDPGMVRQQNQDCYDIVWFNEECLLAVVCDGMGGAKSGNIASRLAVDVFVEEVRRGMKPVFKEGEIPALLRGAAELANTAVYEQAQVNQDFSGMGTTLVGVFVYDSTATVINVGDSRLYFMDCSGIELVTTDHSLVELMVQRGELTREVAKVHPGKNLITRAIGTEAKVEADIFVRPLKKDDNLVLCTDGLSKVMADQEILFEVVHGVHKENCCRRLLDIAINRGAPDNVTVVLITV